MSGRRPEPPDRRTPQPYHRGEAAKHAHHNCRARAKPLADQPADDNTERTGQRVGNGSARLDPPSQVRRWGAPARCSCG
jgi:hypothetical protein